jgi:hypothetical protein
MTNEYLANRYGKGKASARTQRIFWISIGSILVVAFFAWSIMINFAAPAQVSGDIRNFDITSAQQASVTVAVDNPSEQAGVCAVRVLSSNFGVVGYREISFSGSEGKSFAIDTKVNTTVRGVSANIERCWFK